MSGRGAGAAYYGPLAPDEGPRAVRRQLACTGMMLQRDSIDSS